MTSASTATPIAPQAISTGADVRNRRKPTGREVPCQSFGFGHSTASARNDTTSTTAAPQPNSQCGSGRSARAVRPCAIAAAGHSRPAAAVTTPAAASLLTSCSRLDGELQDLHARILAVGLEDAVDGRLQVELRGLARRGVLRDVVAVEVDLLLRVGVDHEVDLVALLDFQLGDAADGLLIDDLDRQHRRLRGGGGGGGGC